MELPTKIPYDLMLTRWASIINPVLSNPATNPSILKDVVLASGSNVIPHKLAQIPQGWFIVDINANVTIYRSAPSTINFLYLTASGAATVSIGVF